MRNHIRRYSPRRNPIGLGFAVDYWAMLDALNKVQNDITQYAAPWSADYQELHHQLDRASYRLRASQFSQIFSDTVSPPGEEPSTTDIYQDIEQARTQIANQGPGQAGLATSEDLLDFVDKLRIVIQTFDRTFVRNQRVLGPIVTGVQRFADNMLTRVHNEQPILDASQVTAVSNMERFRTELTTLNPVNLTLSGLNDFIRQLQPTQPFGYSVMMIYQGLDPSDQGLVQQKTMEFIGLLTQMSDAINPFSQELAGNEELTGWKYLHVKPGRHPRRRNPRGRWIEDIGERPIWIPGDWEVFHDYGGFQAGPFKSWDEAEDWILDNAQESPQYYCIRKAEDEEGPARRKNPLDTSSSICDFCGKPELGVDSFAEAIIDPNVRPI